MSERKPFTEDQRIDLEVRWHPRVTILSLPPMGEEEYRRHPAFAPGKMAALDRIMFIEKPPKGQEPKFDYQGLTYPE